MKDFEDVCFEFQQNIINIFNNQNNIPFFLKYYLIKEIWDQIEKEKMRIDMEVRSKYFESHEEENNNNNNNNNNVEENNNEK